MKTIITIISNGPRPIVYMIFFTQKHIGDFIRFPHCRDTSISSRIVCVGTIRMAREKDKQNSRNIFTIYCVRN